MGVSITFAGDDLEEAHNALIEYAKTQKLIGDEEPPEETEDEEEEETEDEESEDEETEDEDEEEEKPTGKKALRAKLQAIVIKHSKKEGGPNKIRAALKKVAKVQKLSEVPDGKLAALEAELKKVLK